MFSFLKIEHIVYLIAIGAITFAVYTFHFKPLNALKEQRVVCCNSKTALEREKENLEQLLIKAQKDIETEKINVELCELKSEAYKEDNTTIKDTENEGYLIF